MAELSQEIIEQLKAAGLAATPQTTTAAQQVGGFAGWQKPQPSPAAMDVKGVLVPIEIGTSKGNVTCQLMLDAAVVATPDTLIATVEGLINMGVPVKAWQPQQKKGWGK